MSVFHHCSRWTEELLRVWRWTAVSTLLYIANFRFSQFKYKFQTRFAVYSAPYRFPFTERFSTTRCRFFFFFFANDVMKGFDFHFMWKSFAESIYNYVSFSYSHCDGINAYYGRVVFIAIKLDCLFVKSTAFSDHPSNREFYVYEEWRNLFFLTILTIWLLVCKCLLYWKRRIDGNVYE